MTSSVPASLTAALAAHLGPWAGARQPTGYRRTERLVEGPRGAFPAYDYAPAGSAPLGAYLVAPGLHPDGPADPRFDRFCASLAASGLRVLAPFLPDYAAVRISPDAAEDLDASFGALLGDTSAAGLPPPALFSISFGSTPASVVAARRGAQISALVLFGGFADFRATIRFATSGEMPGSPRRYAPRDVLNGPAVFLNILPHLATGPHQPALDRAFRLMIKRTWGRMELKRPGARWPIAQAIADDLPAEVRELFLTGCGLLPGSYTLVERGLDDAGSAFDFTDPRPHLGRVRAPVVIVHGRNDDVIPYTEADKLRAALPPGHPHRAFVTGFYDHTRSLLPGPLTLANEVRTLAGTLRAMAGAPFGVLPG